MPRKKFHYTNGEITIQWEPSLCKHSGICAKGLAKVFNPARKPWIDMSQSDTNTIIQQINQCPSGALSYKLNQKAPITLPLPQVKEQVQLTTVECIPNGPYLIRGMITIKMSDGVEETRVGSTALCRCGASKRKPYCDGTHHTVGFEG